MKRIDWRTVVRILVAIIIAMILTLLIDKFIPNIFTKNKIKIISITVIILNIFSYYKIRTMENTRFSRALKQFKLWDRIIRTFESSAMLSLYSFLMSFVEINISKVWLIASVVFLVWFLVDTIRILKLNRRSG